MDLRNATHCRFCSYFNGGSADEVDTPWLTSNDYCALVSKGALVPGWSLVCPQRHTLGLASDYCRDDFWAFSAKAEAVIRSRYGHVCVFEHGASYVGSPTGCGTDHAHMHLVPLAFSLSTEALRFDEALHWSACRARDIGQKTMGREYLFVSDQFEGDQTTGLLCLLDSPVSQFFRRVVATRLGLREFYDYRRHPMMEIVRDSAHSLRTDVLAGVRVDER